MHFSSEAVHLNKGQETLGWLAKPVPASTALPVSKFFSGGVPPLEQVATGFQELQTANPGLSSVCVRSEVRKNLITATAAASLVGTFCMGGFANLPLALAPGMGLNAYFTYNVVGYYGSGSVSPPCCACLLCEGVLMLDIKNCN